MTFVILYIKNSDKESFSKLKKHVKNDYIMNKLDYPKTVTVVQSLTLNYQHNYNSNSNPNPKVLAIKWSSLNVGKPGMMKAKQKNKIKTRSNLEHITWNDLGGKVTMQEIVNAPPKQISKRIQNHSGRRNK